LSNTNLSNSYEEEFDQELVSIFLEEAEEILQQLDEDLLTLEKEPGDPETINSVFRALHTIKGSAGLTGLSSVSNFAHLIEDVLDTFRREGSRIPDSHMMVILDSIELLKKMVTALTKGGMEDLQERAEEIKELLNFIVDLSPQETAPSQTESTFGVKRYRIHLNFDPDLFSTGTDPLLLIDELSQKGELKKINVSLAELPELETLDPQTLYLKWVIVLDTEQPKEEIEQVFIFVEEALEIEEISFQDDLEQLAEKNLEDLIVEEGLVDSQEVEKAKENEKSWGDVLVEKGKVAPKQVENLASERKQAQESREVTTIRVNTEKVEQIMDQVAELAIYQSRIKNLVMDKMAISASSDETRNVFEEIDKVTRQLQEEVMGVSMVPIGNTFVRFQRMVRDMAREKSKKVDLVISGKETELDRKVIEQITDPLKHMLRNSLDHGLEFPEERQKAGKDPTGKIHLKAYYREGGIVIEIADDGKGLDPDKIWEKAKEKGLVEEGQKLSRDEIMRLPFQPGFSTAEEVSDTSGRGVGLDVVYNNISALRGTVEIESEKGIGTRFRIRLPLTLAIIDAILIKLGQNQVLVPITSIIEFLSLSSDQVRSVTGKRPIVQFRGDYIPLVSLSEILGLEANAQTINEGMVIVVQDQRRRAALLVDEIVDQEQVVVKSIKENYSHVEGVEGATILGDGNVALIIDVPSVIRMGLNQ